MSYNNEVSKARRFDNLMYSDPEYVVFAYTPEVKHLRLLEMQKFMKNDSNEGNDYFHQSFTNFRGQNNFGDNFIFIPKRCMMLDNQLAIIQKQLQGKPINYHHAYKHQTTQEQKTKVFHWFMNHSSENLMINNHNNNSRLFKQYYSYPQINSFCFGRKHFVRSLNSIDLFSDHISRNHCQLIIKKGKERDDMERYFEMVFGIEINRKSLKQKHNKKRQKLSKGNKLHFITRQLWSIIYSFIFLTEDKYFLMDNGSRNGTFFIQCPISKLLNRTKSQQLSELTLALNQYNMYGQKIIENHKLPIKQGYSYEFQGEQYLMKVWRLTESKGSSYSSIKQHNEKTIRYIQQFDQKISWFNNFQKVNKDYVIVDELLRRSLWKGKRVYEEMVMKERERKRKKNDVDVTVQEGLRLQQQQELQQQQQNAFITKMQFVKLIYQQLLIQQKILKKNNISSINQQLRQQQSSIATSTTPQDLTNVQSLFIQQHQINTVVVSLDFSNDYKKIYCIITQLNRVNKFHLGSQMVLNTARFQFEDSQKCCGYIQFDGRGWEVVALTAVENEEKKAKGRNGNMKKDGDDGESDQESDLQEESCELRDMPTKNKNNSKNTQKLYNLNFSSKLSNKIWTKIPATSLYELNPHKCSTYLIRLSHTFYFQLKFINFDGEKQNKIN